MRANVRRVRMRNVKRLVSLAAAVCIVAYGLPALVSHATPSPANSSSAPAGVSGTLAGALLGLTPTTAGPDVVTTSQAFTVSLASGFYPHPGQPVTFKVTGPNATTGQATTDGHGKATFSYVGRTAGVDHVQASATSTGGTIYSTSAAVSWVSLAHATLTLTPANMSNDFAGATQIMSATLTAAGQAIASQTISFAVTGVNATTGSATTNASGVATFAYVGSHVGADTVVASASAGGSTVTSGPAHITWVPRLTHQVAAVSTETAQGDFYAEAAGGTTFGAKPGDTPAFSQTFPTIDFNPPAKTVTGEPPTGPSPTTRPFTDVTTDIHGDYAGTIVAHGSGVQAGVGTLNSFDAVFTSTFVVSKGGDATYNITSSDGFLLGIGGGASRVNGTYVNAPASNTSSFHGYPLVAANNAPGSSPPGTFPVTVHFPAAGVYPYELDYFSSSGQQLSLTLGVASFNAQTSPLSVYFGYADSTRPAASIFPFPWQGSPGVTFVGNGSGGFDAGAIRFDNNSDNPIPLDSVTVNVGGAIFDLWPHSTLVVPPHQILILTQTNGPNLDTSDVGPGGANWAANCTADGVIPQVVVTSNGVATTYTDTKQILNTQGFDTGACASAGAPSQPYIYNESEAWVNISGGGGTPINTPLPPAVSLLLSPAKVGPDVVGQSQSFKVAAMDGAGNPVQSLPISLNVSGGVGGKNTQILHATTDATGNASFSYTGLGAETDTVNASAFIEGLQSVSNTTSLTWNIPIPGGPPNGGTPQQAPPAIAITAPTDGSTLTQPAAVTATITPPATETISTWNVSYHTASSPAPVALASGTGTPPATLANFDPTLLPNGIYIIVVQATASGGGTQTASISVSVPAGPKIGRYVTTFQDLSIPVEGFNADVTRVYDSTDKTVGDFGIGWHLGASNYRVSVNAPLGAGGWSATPNQCSLFGCAYAFTSSTPHYVTVTFPDGHQEMFDFTPQGGFGPLFFFGQSAFTPRANTATTSTLAVDPASDPGVQYGFDTNLYAGSTSAAYNPTRFVLTETNGTKLLLDESAGLVSETDLHGNKVSFDPSGVHAVNGAGTAEPGIAFTRDGQGRITKVTGPTNQTISYVYTPGGDLQSVTDPVGNLTTFTYDTHHDLLKTTGPGGPLQTQTYDASGRMVSITDADGNTVAVVNNAGASQQVLTDPNGQLTTILTLDTQGNIASNQQIAGGASRTTESTYNLLGEPTSQTDPLGNVTTNTYDAKGDRTSTTDALGHTTTRTYNNFGELNSNIDPLGHTTSAMYDASGNLMSLTDQNGNPTHLSYDTVGNPATVKAPSGALYQLTYDAAGNLLKVVDPLDHTTSATYDASGHRLSLTDSLNKTTNYLYDPNGRQISVKDPLGDTTVTAYDTQGLVQKTTDPNGNTTTYARDLNGNVTQILDALGHTVNETYDVDGNLASLTDPDGRTRSYAYDGYGEQTSAFDPATGNTTTAYDAAGRTSAVTTARGTTNFGYDAVGQKISETAGALTTSWTYDNAGQRSKMTDATGTTSYNYDASGRVTNVTSPHGALAYTYDANGQRKSMNLGAGKTINYSYDAAGHLATLTDWAANTITLTNDANGDPITVAYANGVTTATTYDDAGRIASVTSTKDATVLASTRYQRDNDGNPTKITTPAGTTTETYDHLSRLLTSTGPAASQTYSYDPAGNITQSTNGTTATPFSYDQTSGLLTNVGTQSVTHDGAGDITGIATQHFVWDQLGRLASSTSGAATSTYTYNGDGLLNTATAGTPAPYLWDPAHGPNNTLGGNAALVDDGSTAYLSSALGPLAQTNLSTGAQSSYLTDALGSVLGVVGPNGTATASATYAPFGIPSTTGALGAQGFTGEVQQPVSNLLYLRARWMDPSLASFLSPDSVQPNAPGSGGYNLYAYALDNPTSLVDPSGHSELEYSVANITGLRASFALVETGVTLGQEMLFSYFELASFALTVAKCIQPVIELGATGNFSKEFAECFVELAAGVVASILKQSLLYAGSPLVKVIFSQFAENDAKVLIEILAHSG
jgi:RHS repeat-associated protein